MKDAHFKSAFEKVSPSVSNKVITSAISQHLPLSCLINLFSHILVFVSIAAKTTLQVFVGKLESMILVIYIRPQGDCFNRKNA